MYADAVKMTMDELRKHHQAFVQSDVYLTAVRRFVSIFHRKYLKFKFSREQERLPFSTNWVSTPNMQQVPATVLEESSHTGFRTSHRTAHIVNEDDDDEVSQRPAIINESDEQTSGDSPTHQVSWDRTLCIALTD